MFDSDVIGSPALGVAYGAKTENKVTKWKRRYVLFPAGGYRVHTHTHTLYSKLYLLEKNKKLVSTDPLTWVWATLTFVEAQEKILSVWAKTEQWISMMDSLSWQAVPLHTWGFPVMSDFSHGQLELLLAFNRGPALNPLYNLWPSFVLPGAQPFFLKIMIFLLFPFMIIPEYLFVFILFSFPRQPSRRFPFLFILAIILERLFHAPSSSVSLLALPPSWAGFAQVQTCGEIFVHRLCYNKGRITH